MMRILQVTPFAFDEVGGVSEHVRNIANCLARTHDVTVYATDPRKHFPRHEFVDGIEIERFNRYAPSNAYFFSLDMLLALRKAKFDIVHAHCYHALPMHFAQLATCKKLIITPHFHGVGHSTFRNTLVRLLKPLGRRTLERADKIVAVSEYERNLLCTQFGLSSNSVVVVPNGVILDEFSALRRRSHEFKTILHVGNLHDYKGSLHLVEVLPKLQRDTALVIVGRGPLRSLLEKRAKELGVRDRIIFFEYLSRKELLQKYSDADVFVLLSKYEAYSIVVAEALTAGTPCIVANTSALSEWVDNKTCYGIDFPIDLNHLASEIEHVLGRDSNEMLAQKWVGTKILDWKQITARLESIYLQ